MTKPFGLLAEFDSPKTLLMAARKVKQAGYNHFEAYSPFPIHGMDDAMGLKPSYLGWIVLCGGLFGAIFGFGLQAWVATMAYPLVISGKPLLSTPAFIPITFELMVLFSAFAAVFGMLAINKLPLYYHPVFKASAFKTVTSHGFFLGVEATDPLYNRQDTHALLKKMGSGHITEVDQ
ncbi:MAG: DUF3341 domain-containing protein [Candidatus Margulisbacteria bacterium]|nr:DUF3341 domain-containing protein [Candidatus Margulisiibacteriota bacterium]